MGMLTMIPWSSQYMELKSSISQAPFRPGKHRSLLFSAHTECKEFSWSSSSSLCPERFKKL